MLRQLFSRLFCRPAHTNEVLDLRHLTQLVRRYAVEQQQVPKDLSELVALHYIETIPAPPQGQRFVIDRKGVEVRLE